MEQPAEELTSVANRRVFPSLRCVMGDWVYYVTSMRFVDVASWVKRTDEIYESEKLRDLVQRAISDRVDTIVEYLLNQPERFFNAIIVGVYEGAPKWYPIEIGSSRFEQAPPLDEHSQDSLGVLALEGHEKVFAIDGQHRVEAIKQALVIDDDLQNEDLSVIFVAHGTTAEKKERTRRLFSTLNKHAKPVSKGEIIALDEDDAFAITTRRLVEEYELLKSGFRDKTGYVYFGKQAPLPAANRQHLTSINTLYNLCGVLYVPFSAAVVKAELGDKNHAEALRRLRSRRPDQEELDRIYDQQTTFWGHLTERIAPLQRLFESAPEEQVAGHYRLDEGHLLFRPKGQVAFMRAIRALMDRGQTLPAAIEALSRAPMAMAETPWRNTLWEAGTGKMKKGVSAVFLESLFLYMVNEEPRSGTYRNLEEKYQQILDDTTATLPDPVR